MMDLKHIRIKFFKLGSLCLGLAWAMFMSFGTPWAVEYGLSNAPAKIDWPEPRTVIVLPSGQRIDPWVTLPDGWILSDDGSVINEDGLLIKKDGTIEYPFGSYPKGYVEKPDGTIVTPEGFTIHPKAAEAKRLEKLKADVLAKGPKDPEKIAQIKETVKKETKPDLPKGAKVLADGTVILPDGRKIDPQGKIIDSKKEEPVVKVQPKIVPSTQQKPVIVEGQQADEPVQLWSMLPLTEVPGQRKTPKQETANAVKPTHPNEPNVKPNKAQEKPVKPTKQEAKAEPKPKNTHEPKPIPPKEKPKPKMGEYLHIPPEAVATGNLDFLEGCCQGTRPEYYTKRSFYDCFCFGINGSGGKRKIIDPSGGRRCVGSTTANLNRNGVLNVSSSGAVCSDGERWGQAEMTCRGKGQHTPCSWVFKDANGGRQAYEIPFVRVQACGRRR